MADHLHPVLRAGLLVPTPNPLPSAGGPRTPQTGAVCHGSGAPARTGLPTEAPTCPPQEQDQEGLLQLQQRGHHAADGAGPDCTKCGVVAWAWACRHVFCETTGPRQYRPADLRVLACMVAAITMGPVAIWPGQLLPPVPHPDARPCQPASTHTRTTPRTVEQLYAVAATLLVDGRENFLPHNGPALVASNILGRQHEAPDPWSNTLRGRTRICDRNGDARPPVPHPGEVLLGRWHFTRPSYTVSPGATARMSWLIESGQSSTATPDKGPSHAIRTVGRR